MIMHPMKKGVQDAINAKMRKLTTHYGEADKKANIKAPAEKLKLEGPEEAVGFGANSDDASPRADRAGRRSISANPVATYAKGGLVKNAMEQKVARVGSDANAQKKRGSTDPVMQGGVQVTNGRGAKVTKHLISQKMHSDGNSGGVHRARGGHVKGKGKGSTHVNVIVAPHPGNPDPTTPSPQLAALAMGARPPAAPPQSPPPGPSMPPMAGAGAAPMMPPGAGMPMRKRGGRIDSDAVTEHNYVDEGLIRKARGGGVDGVSFKGGNTNVVSKAGNVSGVGRLEKMLEFEKHGNKKKQEV